MSQSPHPSTYQKPGLLPRLTAALALACIFDAAHLRALAEPRDLVHVMGAYLHRSPTMHVLEREVAVVTAKAALNDCALTAHPLCRERPLVEPAVCIHLERIESLHLETGLPCLSDAEVDECLELVEFVLSEKLKRVVRLTERKAVLVVSEGSVEIRDESKRAANVASVALGFGRQLQAKLFAVEGFPVAEEAPAWDKRPD